MSVVLLIAASSLFAQPMAKTAALQAGDRVEYWLYPPGIAPGGRQRWGVITAPTQSEAQQELQRRQDSQRKWWAWVGARDAVDDDPYSYVNFMGPINAKSGPVRIPAGISTSNVWIVSLEEVEARRRATAELADLRMKLEAAKEVQDALLPIGTNTKIAADLRGRTIYYSAQISNVMAKVREVEAILQASQGYTLADAMYELDELGLRIQVLSSQLPPQAAEAAAATPAPPPPAPSFFSAPTGTPPIATGGATVVAPMAGTDPAPQGQGGTTTPVKPPETGGATVLIPAGEPAKPATQGSSTTTVLVPGGGTASTVKVKPGPDGLGPTIDELNKRFGNYAPTRANDPTISSYSFDRDGFTIRKQIGVNGQFQIAPPERIAYTTIPDPSKLFVGQTDHLAIYYGNSDLTKGDVKAIVNLPDGSTAASAQEALAMLKSIVSKLGGGNFAPAAETLVAPTAPSEAEANARMDAAVAAIKAPQAIVASELLASSLPEWLRSELLGRAAGTPDGKTLATQYSARLAEGAEVLDETGKAVTLEQLANSISGQDWRNGPADRAAWTVTSYEDKSGEVTVTLQASYVGHSAAQASDRAVHGAKVQEVWLVTAEATTIKKIKLLRAGTVYRITPPKPSDFVDRHTTEGTRLISENRPQAALVPFEAALRISPDRADLWSQYGLALYRVGQNFESLASYRLARDLDPKNVLIISNYAGVLRSLGDYSTSIAASKQAIEIDPNSVWARESLALAYFASKDYKSSATEYAGAVKLQPNDGRLRANYASALLRAGLKKEALVEAQQAYSAGFKDHWVFAQLGIKG